MKKVFCVILVIISLFVAAIPAAATEVAPTPRYVNVSDIEANLNISNTGLATMYLQCVGNEGTTLIMVSYWIEKVVNGSWIRVDIEGSSTDTWTDVSYSRYLSKTRTYQLNEAGSYRLTAKFTVTIDTNETITLYAYDYY